MCLRGPQRAKFAGLLDLIFGLAHAFVTASARLLYVLLAHGVHAEEFLAAFPQLKLIVQRRVACALIVFRLCGFVTRAAPVETRAQIGGMTS